MINAPEPPTSDEVAFAIDRDKITIGFISPVIASLLLAEKIDHVPLMVIRHSEDSVSLCYTGKSRFLLGPLRTSIINLVEKRSLFLISLTPPAMNKIWQAGILAEVSP